MAGEYRLILPKALKKIGENEIATAIEDKEIMLAIKTTLLGDVNKRDDLTQLFIDSLSEFDYSPEEQPVVDKYLNGLKSGDMLPVCSFAGKTYKPGQEYYALGELYLTS